MKNKTSSCFFALCSFVAFTGHAQNFDFKADNPTALNTAGSWSNSIMPTAADWAVWDATVSVANCTNENLGAASSWGGIQILNPPSGIAITNTGKILTLGSLGIDMNEPATTADLYLFTQLTSGGGEWNIKPGRTLNIFEGSSQAALVSGDLAINGYVRLNDKDFRIATANLYLTNTATTLDFSAGTLSFSVGYGASCIVSQTGGKVNLFKSSTSTGALLIGCGSSGPFTSLYNLSGGVVQDTNATTADYISVGDASGHTGMLNLSGGSVSVPQIQIGNSGYGYVNVTNGTVTTFNSPGNDLIVNKGANSLGGWLNVYGGVVNVINHNLVVGKGGAASVGSQATVYLTNGTINVGASLQIPGGGANNTPGTVTIDGGALNVTNNVTLLAAGNGNGTLTLNGGVLTASSVGVGSGTGAGVFTFNGGTLRARGNSGNFIANTNNLAVNVMGGGAVIDSAGFNVTINAPLLNGTGGSGDGGLAKVGSGTLTLAGNNTYLGATILGGGTLSLATTNPAGGVILPGNATLVATNGTLDTTLAVAGTTLICSNLVFGGAGGAVVAQFDCGTNSDPATPFISATNGLVIMGTVAVNFYGSSLTPGVIPLIQYTGALTGGGAFALGLVQGWAGYITNNVPAQQVQLVITGASVLDWRSLVNTNWDFSTLNWFDLTNNTAAVFGNGATIFFDDSTSNALVNVTTLVMPGTMTVNNTSSNYVFSGAGGIGGTAGLTKLGTGLVTMGISNSYSGATVISNGVFRLGTNYAIPSVSDATLEGRLDLAGYSTGVHSLNGNNGVVDNSGAGHAVLTVGGNGGTFAGLITNSGASLTLSKGAGTLILLNANAYAGGTTNGGGGLQLASERSIGTGPITLNGGTLYWVDANAHTLTNAMAIGGGVTFGQATNGPLTVTSIADFAGSSHQVTANTDVSFPNGITNGGVNGKSGPGTLTLKNTTGDWSSGSLSINLGSLVLDSCTVTQDGSNIRIQCSTNAVARLAITNGATLVMAGSGTSNFRFGDNAAAGTDATNILDLSGTLYLTPLGPTSSNDKFQMGSSTDPSGQNIVNLLAGGVLCVRQVQDNAPASVSTFNFNGGTLRPSTNDNAAAFMQGLDNCFVLPGGAVIDTAGFNISISQAFLNDGTDADGGLIKRGLGILYLNGVSTYTNTTQINAGSLAGTGVLTGPVAVASGASLLAGPSPTVLGTLTINNAVTIASGGSVVMKIDKIGGGISSDNISSGTTFNFGGTLVVTTNVDMTDAFAIGDMFTLFNAAAYHGSFSAFNLPALPSGMGWDTSQLGVNGSIQVVSAPATPPIFTSVALQSGGNLVMSGSGGTAFGSYRVYANTNLASSSGWIPIATNQFDAGGNFMFTNIINPANPAQFYTISNP